MSELADVLTWSLGSPAGNRPASPRSAVRNRLGFPQSPDRWEVPGCPSSQSLLTMCLAPPSLCRVSFSVYLYPLLWELDGPLWTSWSCPPQAALSLSSSHLGGRTSLPGPPWSILLYSLQAGPSLSSTEGVGALAPMGTKHPS